MAKIKARWKLTLSFIVLLLCIWAFNALSIGAVKPQALSWGKIENGTVLAINDTATKKECTGVYDNTIFQNPDFEMYEEIPETDNRAKVVSSINVEMSGNLNGAITFTVKINHGVALTESSIAQQQYGDLLDLDLGKVRIWLAGKNEDIVYKDCDLTITNQKTYTFTINEAEYDLITNGIVVHVQVLWNTCKRGGFNVVDCANTIRLSYQTKKYKFNFGSDYPITLSNAVVTGEDNTLYYKDGFSFSYTTPKSSVNGTTIKVYPEITATVNGTTIASGKEYKYTQEGVYDIVVSNYQGARNRYHIIVDRTAPTLTVTGTGADGIYRQGTAKVTYSSTAREAPISTAQYIYNGISVPFEGSVEISDNLNPTYTDYTSGTVLSSQGRYVLTVTDKVGNVAQTEFLVMSTNSSTINLNDKRMKTQGYFKADNYKVKIPYLTSIYIPYELKDGQLSTYEGEYNNACTYVFATYENALTFMSEIELTYSVIETGNGQYRYKQLNNPNATATYTNVAELRSVIEHYASAYVYPYGETTIGSSVYIDSSTVVMDSAVYSSATKEGLFHIDESYVFQGVTTKYVTKKKTYTYQSLTKLKIDVHNGSAYQTIYNGTYQVGKAFGSYIGTYAGKVRITEYDSIGNANIYVGVYDALAPTISAYYEHYNGENELIKGIRTLVNGLEMDNNLKTLVVSALYDEYDTIVFARVEKPNGEYEITRDISKLQFGVAGYYEQGGEYRLKVYDRSLNVFEYAFVIAGGEPKVTSDIKGIGENRYLHIEFANPNSYSSITGFTIYRYGVALPNGAYEEKIDGEVVNTVNISQNVWSYNFMLGGIYTVRFTDSFNRLSVSEEIVFKKGLPEYTLTGVSENGKTNKAVAVTFKSTIGNEVYLDGELKTGYVVQTADGYKLEIPATIENNGQWFIKLYQKSDTPTYITLTFRVDTIAPVATVCTESGENLYWSTRVNTPFTIQWDTVENVEKVKYAIDGSYYKTYSKGNVLTEDGVYSITLTDDVGNQATYAIELDTTVAYKVTYSTKTYEDEGITYANQGFTVIDEENLSLTVAVNGAPIEARFNAIITNEGVYDVYIQDVVGNVANFTVVIDKTAPTLTVMPGTDKYAPVTVRVDVVDVADYTITYNAKKVTKQLEEELTFSEWGEYSFVVADKLGNKRTETFEIAKYPPVISAYDVDGNALEINAVTNKAIYFTWNDESATGRVSLDGTISRAYTQSAILNDEGVYTLTVTDGANNKVTYTVEIVKVINVHFVTATDAALETLVVDGVERTNIAFTVKTDDDLSITVTKDGQAFTYTFGQQIAEDGEYYFYVFDELGNYESRTIVVDTLAPTLTLGARIDDYAPVTVTVDVNDTATIEIKHVAGRSTTESVFPSAELTFDKWGTYEIKATDVLGNVASVTFEIKKVAPTLTVQGLSGKVLTDGETSREPIVITVSENVIVKYKLDNTYSRVYQANDILSEQGAYKITTTDEAGNYIELNVTIDCEIKFGVIMDGTTIKDFTNTNVGKRYVELTPQETMTITHAYNDGESELALGTVIKVTDEGKHTFCLTDEVGNSITITFVVDRTAPLANIDTDAYTKSDVILSVDDLNDVESYKIFKDGLSIPKYVLAKNNTFTEQGTYSVTLSDSLGNKRTIEFAIKRAIEYKLSIANGFVTDKKVTLTLKEDGLTIVAAHNGKPLELATAKEYSFENAGSYSIKITDVLGNEKVLTFTIDATEYRKDFSFNIPLDSEIKLMKDGKELDVDTMINGDTLTVTEDGKYYLTLKCEGVTSSYEFIIDTVLPKLLLNGAEFDGTKVFKKNLTLSTNKKTVTMEVYYNGAIIDYNGEELSSPGTYKIVLKDKVGNVAEYEFERAFTFNAGAIILFVMGGVLVVLIIVLIIRRRIKQRIM